MKSYNGFSATQRSRCGNWQSREYKAGRIQRPTVCCACGATENLIAHCEDYSEPFTFEKSCKYPLCYRCHMAVHCRLNAPEMWQRYRAAIEGGTRYPAIIGNNWPRFRADHLMPGRWPEPELVGDPPERRPLAEIEAYATTPGARLGNAAGR